MCGRQLGQPGEGLGLAEHLGHRRQRGAQSGAVVHLAQPGVANDEQAAVGFAADQPPEGAQLRLF